MGMVRLMLRCVSLSFYITHSVFVVRTLWNVHFGYVCVLFYILEIMKSSANISPIHITSLNITGGNYPKHTDQSILTGGHNVDQNLCSGFDSNGYTRGKAGSIVENLDYHNAFVGHYEAGEIQYNGESSSSLNSFRLHIPPVFSNVKY